ncbi:MAG: translocation/assembly module TamB domain-containing protein [Treponema sp.]|nr:translocation/assembly module TamB domain-containing protein [Treponema sp.]
MKKLTLITRISIAIFLFIMTLALALAIPVYKRLETIVDKYTSQLCDQVTEITGLTLSYDSISPSVLAYLGIKGIKVSDSKGRVLVDVNNTHIKYKLLPLLKGEYDSIIKGVAINGVDVNVSALIDFIKELPSKNVPPGSEKSEKPPQRLEDIYDTIQIVMDYIPPNVTVKNLRLEYINSPLNASLLVKEIRVLNPANKASIDFNIKSTISAVYNKINVTGDAVFNGSLMQTIDNSFVNINLANITQGNYKLNKFNFIVSYKDKKVDFRTVQNVMPFAVNFVYDIDTKDMEAEVKTENLNPVSVLQTAANDKVMSMLKDMTVTMKTGIKYSHDGSIKYDSIGNVLVPDSLFPGGATVKYSLNGNDKKITLSYLDIDGKNCTADISLSFLFKTLQLSGIADLREYVLPNGNKISTEVYFDPLASSGFMIFSPQLFIGEKALTALQARIMPRNDSIDFDFEVNDYSHIDQDTQSVIKADGSYLTESKYIQTSVSLNSIYFDTILGIIKELIPSKNTESIQKAESIVADYVFSGDAYFSTDFKSVSYNVPYIVMANTKKDNQLILLALNGNEQSIQLNKFNMIYGSMALDATASLDSMPGSSDKFYTIDIMSSSIPYHFSGTIMPEIITLTGDYGTDAELRFGKNKSMEGFASFNGLPFIINKAAYIVSMDTLFDYTKEQGPQITLQRFQLEKDTPDTSVNPRLELTGSGTKYGAQVNSISYTDIYSSLSGTSDITINIDDKVFSSAGIQMNLKDSITDEALVIDANVSNPDGVELSAENVFKSLYVNAMIELSHFSLNRFMSLKHDNNELSASLYVSGTLEHPYAAASVQKLTFLLNDEIVSSSGSVVLEERDITINEFSLNAGKWRVSDVSGAATLTDYTGNISAVFSTEGKKSFRMPLVLSIEDSYIPENSAIPASLMVKLSCPGMDGTLFKKPVPFDISVNYTDGFISFFSSNNMGLMGTFEKTNGLYASWNMGDILSTEITGKFEKTDTFVKMTNINVNLHRLLDNITIDDFIKVDNGLLKGSMTLYGPFDTPEFKGALSISNPSLLMPVIFSQKLSTDKILLTAANNEFTVAESVFNLKNTPKFKMSSKVYMNKWSMDRFEMRLFTLDKQSVPIKLNNPLVKIEGDTECDISLALENHNFDISGTVFAENLNVSSDITEITNRKNQGEDEDSALDEMNLTTNLELKLGTHSSLNFNPLLRCVFVPHTSVVCKIDTATDSYQLDGSLQLKSGDVAYLNRNFYIKEGNIKFNPQDISNPLITISAETRERDTNGDTVRIILGAENQYLLDFNPRFTSIPAKSENEIRLLLGQIVLADSSSVGELVVSAGEYYLQSTVVRDLENKLRDLLNFDIFSVRTNILQNTINLSTQRTKTKEMSIGNFFDNSTVYIGKYIGSALYVDAMLNMSATDYSDAEYFTTSKLLFQPEFGLELELPVINIRWDMSWDMTPGLQFKSYIPSTSVSLSWKFTF